MTAQAFVQRMRSFVARLSGVFRSQKIEEDLRAEMRAHIEMRTELLIERGSSPDQARDEARRRFGNRTHLQEEARSQELLPRIETLTQDLRYGLRLLRRNPGFTAVAVVVLGLGIGLNAAMFSVFHQVLLAPLPFPQPDRLFVVSSHAPSLGDARRAASGPDFRDLRDQSTVFSHVAAVIPGFAEVWTGDGEPRVVNCASPTVDFFNVLGIRPILGRAFVPAEFHDLHNSTLLVSYKFWQNQLGGDPHVIGRIIHIEDVPSQIVGVMPPMPDLYSDVDVWLKLATEPSWDFMNWRANKFLDLVGRLRPGVSPRVAEQEITAILRRGAGEPADVRAQLTPLQEFIVGPMARQLDILMLAVAVVLLITLLNTAAILLARSIKRTPEMAVRLGLGASRWRVRRQLLVEGVLLSSAGGVLGVVLALLGVAAVRQFSAGALPRMDGLGLSGAAIAVSVGVVLVSSIVFTILPGALLEPDLATHFRGGRTETGRAQRPFASLIVAEIACAMVLSVCAGLLVRSFMHLQSIDLGYEPDRTISAYLRTNYDSSDGYPFWHDVLSVGRAVPGAVAAGISDCVPSMRANSATLQFANRPSIRGREPSAEACWISADYFTALGAPLVHGRSFTEHDDANGAPVAIINTEAARRFFPTEDPIGKRIAVSYLALGSKASSEPRMREIVGVVSTFRQRGVDVPPGPAVYLPYTQDETYHVLNSMHLYVRSASNDPGGLGRSIRARVQSAYPNQPVENIQVMRQVIAHTLVRRTSAALLMTGFAALALLLSALGIYGVISYATQQRTREFGIRIALGAQGGDVLGDVLKAGGVLVVVGVSIGTGISLLVARTLSQLLFETAAADPVVYGVTALILAVTGIAASIPPAVRASRLDPRRALSIQ